MTLQHTFSIHQICTRLFLITSLILGISFSYVHSWYIFLAFMLLFVCMYLCWIHTNIVISCILLFLVGYMRLQYQLYSYNRITNQIETHKPLHIQGIVKHIEPAQHPQYRYTLLIKVTDHLDQQQKTYTPYTKPWHLHCYTSKRPAFQVGDVVRLTRIKVSTRPGESFAQYLIKEGIHATAFLHNTTIERIHHPTFHLWRTIDQCRQRLRINIQKKCSPTTHALISSIFLGNRLCVKKHYQKLKDLFGNWGIIHFLARSGLHLIIFILLLHALLQWIPVPFLYKQFGIICLSLFYAAFTWSSISFCRALISFLWYKSLIICGYQTDMIHIILILASIFLLINPMLLFYLDFQLSFSLTFVLTLTNRYLIPTKTSVPIKALNLSG